jgi:hypothetical protein
MENLKWLDAIINCCGCSCGWWTPAEEDEEENTERLR